MSIAMRSSPSPATVMARTRELLADNAALRAGLAAAMSRSDRIARSHPRCVRGGSLLEPGPEDDGLRRDVRGRLIEGAMPSPARLVWAHRGLGTTCSVCGLKIQETEAEYEVRVNSATLFAHVRCFDIWQEEATALGITPTDGGFGPEA